MAYRRFSELRDALNRTLNLTVSEARLTVVPHTLDRDAAFIARVSQRVPRHFTSIPLGNNHFLSVRIDVRLIGGIEPIWIHELNRIRSVQFPRRSPACLAPRS